MTAALAPAAAGAPANGDAALAGALPTARGALPLAPVMSAVGAAGEEGPDAFNAGAPSSTSGSSSSADDSNNVGIRPESEGASGTDLLDVGGGEPGAEPGKGSVPESSSAPYASKSSSGFIGPFDAVVGGDAVAVDA
jgi:hypothetical protein